MGKGSLANKNKSRLIKAMKEAKANLKAITDALLIKACRAYAVQAVRDCVYNYLDSSGHKQLTGNTAFGFAAGVFANGKLIKPIITAAAACPELRPPSRGYAKPGDTGFQDYGTNEFIEPGNKRSPYVRNYKNGDGFVNVRDGNSTDDAKREISSYAVSSSDKVTVVLVNAVPYAEFLMKERGFDIIESVKYNVKHDLIRIVEQTDFSAGGGKHTEEKRDITGKTLRQIMTGGHFEEENGESFFVDDRAREFSDNMKWIDDIARELEQLKRNSNF